MKKIQRSVFLYDSGGTPEGTRPAFSGKKGILGETPGRKGLKKKPRAGKKGGV